MPFWDLFWELIRRVESRDVGTEARTILDVVEEIRRSVSNTYPPRD